MINQRSRMSTPRQRKIKLTIRKKRLPLFDQLIWREIIQKYLSPQDAIRLSATCSKLRTLIRDQLNFYWYYQYLIRTGKIKIKGFRHSPEPQIVNCLSGDLAKKYGFPLSYRGHPGNKIGDSAPTKEVYLKTHLSPLTEHPKIIENENLTKQVLGDTLQLPSSFCRTNCLGKNHWNSYYFSFEQWSQMNNYEKDRRKYNPTKNYFFEYLDFFYLTQKYTCLNKVAELNKGKLRLEDELAGYSEAISSVENSLAEMKRKLPERLKDCQRRIDMVKDKIEYFQPIIHRYELETYDGPVQGHLYFKEELRKSTPNKHWYQSELVDAWRELPEEEKQNYRDLVHQMQKDHQEAKEKWFNSRI